MQRVSVCEAMCAYAILCAVYVTQLTDYMPGRTLIGFLHPSVDS